MNEEAARKRPLYLITGAAGHVGSALIVRLLERGERVRALVLPGDPFEAEPGVEVFHGDVCEPESLEPFFTNAEGLPLVVIHAAGIVSIASGYREAVYRAYTVDLTSY